MGSRKKKPAQTKNLLKERFFYWYRELTIMDKIALKSWLYNFNRSRITLQDLFRYPYFWQCSFQQYREKINQGYACRWWTGFSNHKKHYHGNE